MDIRQQVRLKFYGVDFAKVNFTSDKPYTASEDSKITININPKVFYPINDEKHFKILMEVNISSEEFFNLELYCFGNFELDRVVIDEIKRGFINVNAPAIMFPYIRSFISTFTANLGMPMDTIIIPPQFFQGDLEEVLIDDLN